MEEDFEAYFRLIDTPRPWYSLRTATQCSQPLPERSRPVMSS